MQEILEDLKAWLEQAKPDPERTKDEHVQTVFRCLKGSVDRHDLVSAMGRCVWAIEMIDAEAENAKYAKYLEQARALLVAAHGAGAKWFRIESDGLKLAFGSEPPQLNWWRSADAEPHLDYVTTLATLIRDLEAKP